MQLHILQRKSPFCLQISVFAFFAKLLKFSRKLEKWSCKWCKSAIEHNFRLNFDTFFGKLPLKTTSDDKNDKQILKFIKTCVSGLTVANISLYLQKNSIFGLKSASLRKISLFAVNDLLFYLF